MQVKAIIFDTDGMLINGEMFSKRLEKMYGISTEKTKSFFVGKFQECLIGKADLKEELEKLVLLWGWEGSVEDMLCFWFEGEAKVEQRMLDMVGKLKEKGIKCYVATNQEKYRTQFLLDQLNFKSIFDKVYSSAELGYKKPSQDFFAKIFQDNHGLAKNQTMFWDDDETNVLGAKEFGFASYQYKNFEDFVQKINL